MLVTDAKRSLRREIKEALCQIAGAQFVSAGEAAAAALLMFIDARVPKDSAARVVALFASLPTEIDTRPLDERLRHAGFARALPAVVEGALVFRTLLDPRLAIHDLPRGPMGIPTPPPSLPAIDQALCDIVVVPGLAFDLHGGRLGYGRGLYDRALMSVDLSRAVGVCLDDQLVPAVPREDHDVRLRWLCTPARGVFALEDDSARR